MSDEMTPQRFAQLASSFDSAAEVYERYRPIYPADAVDWLLEGSPSRVLDLGAGTGKFTRLIVDRVDEIVAVDPSERMLQQLNAIVPSADTRLGTGEQIPLADTSVDAVISAQAWHWADHSRAEPEVARVLVPGGTLGLVWNIYDDREPWVAALLDITNGPTGTMFAADAPTIGALFEPLESFETTWVQEVTRGQLTAVETSVSRFISATAAEQKELLAAIDELLDTHPALAGERDIRLPFRTFAYRTTVRPVP